MNPWMIAAALAAAMAAPSTHAKKGHWQEHGHHDYAKVVSATPVYRRVRIVEPREECWEERVVHSGHARPSPAAGAITGAILGGVIGHQFGSGRGQDVATAAGAVLGARIGEQAAQERHGRAERVNYETHCRTLRRVRFEERVHGYDVTYRYHGRLYRTRLPYDPGTRIPVHVRVTPQRD